MNTPKDILSYVFENNLEYDFMNSIMKHIDVYSIAEIADGIFKEKDGKYKFKSKAYDINVGIFDDEIMTAIANKLYISAFISRHNESYQVHFMVHAYPIEMKSRFEEEIAREVVQYMIMKTIIALRLDTFEKVREYVEK